MVPEGAVVMVGGFMGVGSPQRLIDELVRQRRGGLTIVCNDTARPGVGVGRLLDARPRAQGHRQPYRHEPGDAATHAGWKHRGRARAARHVGGAGSRRWLRSRRILTPTGVGTLVAEGKRTLEIDGGAMPGACVEDSR